MGDVELEAPDLEDVDEVADPFKKLVAVGVVLVTLFGAIVAYYQSVESNREDRAARDAQREAVAGLGAQVDASSATVADLRISSEVDIQLQRQALNAARVNAVSGDTDSDVHQIAQERFAAVAEAIAPLTPVDPADPSTIDQVVADLGESPDAARLRQAIEADLANDHGSKADLYVAVLSILAVSLFLLGLSLTVQGRSRFVLVAPGVVIAFVCVGWALYISGRSVTSVSQRSINAAAAGQRLQDAGDFDGAIGLYNDAIEDSPRFAAAFARRASARFLLGSPQQGQTSFVSITSHEALDDAIADLDRALELGGDSDVNTVAEAGFFHFLDGDFDRSVDLSSEALDLNDQLAPVWFNLGVAEIARGNRGPAEDAYRQGLRVLDGIPDLGTRSAVLAGARTDLSVLRDLLEPDQLDDVDSFIADAEGRLANYELSVSVCPDGNACEAADGGDAEIQDGAFERIGAFVAATIPIDGLEPGDSVAAVWYFRTDDAFPFAQAFLSFDAELVDDDGSVFTSTLPIADPPCPVGGEFLVRLYAGSDFIGETTGTLDPSPLGERFTAFADPIEGIEACVPEGFEIDRADVSALDAFTTFGTDTSPFAIAVNVTPGALLDGQDPVELETLLLDAVFPDLGIEKTPVQLFGRDLDGNFVTFDGLMAIDEASGLAAATVAGPDSAARSIVLSGEVDEARLREAIGLVTFTGVATSAG